MRRTLFWKEMREMAPVLGGLIALELLLCLGLWIVPAGALPDRALAHLALFAAAAVGAALFARERRPGTLSLLFSLPVSRDRILAAKLAAGLVTLLLVALGGWAAGRLALDLTWSWAPEPAGPALWETALSATALLSFLVATRVALDRPEPLLPIAVGGGLGALAFRLIWIDPALFPGNVMAFLALLCACGAVTWRLQARFGALEDRAPRWPRFRAPKTASRKRAPTLLAIEWRQKRVLWGALALLPFLFLIGGDGLGQIAVLAWLAGSLVGASLFPTWERDASRFLLHFLPIGRGRLAAGRLLGGLIVGSLFLAECLLILWVEAAIDRRSFEGWELSLVAFVFFYCVSFLIGAALSPWLRSTVMTVLIAVISTYLLLLVTMVPLSLWIDSFSKALSTVGALLAVLAAIAGWSTARSRAFEPSPRKDFLVILVVFAVWLLITGILYTT